MKSGKGYTRGRRPIKLVYSKKFLPAGRHGKNKPEQLPGKSLAAKEEARIKKLARKEKINLVKNSKP